MKYYASLCNSVMCKHYFIFGVPKKGELDSDGNVIMFITLNYYVILCNSMQ